MSYDYPNGPWGEEPPTASGPAQRNLEAESDQDRLTMRRLSRKSFLWAGVSVLGAYGGIRFLDSQRQVDGTPWPFRVVLETNEQIERDLYADRLARTFDPSLGREPTINSLDEEENQDDIDVDDWRLRVEGLHGHDDPVKLTMAQLKKLPIIEQTTELNCIEGWTTVVYWKGIRFRDFAKRYGPQTTSGDPPDVEKRPGDLLEYVSLQTVEGAYYVGLDIASALHPQTLLAFEMNGKPLTNQHGYPLRLVIPSKYGIKNIKRIGKIAFTANRPRDYWAEQGYDWYAGL